MTDTALRVVLGEQKGDSPIGEVPDQVWGAKAIGRVIGRTPAQTFHMLEKGHLPAQKIGRLWVASRRRLQAVGLPKEVA
jgi:hypothetical protein